MRKIYHQNAKDRTKHKISVRDSEADEAMHRPLQACRWLYSDEAVVQQVFRAKQG